MESTTDSLFKDILDYCETLQLPRDISSLTKNQIKKKANKLINAAAQNTSKVLELEQAKNALLNYIKKDTPEKTYNTIQPSDAEFNQESNVMSNESTQCMGFIVFGYTISSMQIDAKSFEN